MIKERKYLYSLSADIRYLKLRQRARHCKEWHFTPCWQGRNWERGWIQNISRLSSHRDRCPAEIRHHSTPYKSTASLDWAHQSKLLRQRFKCIILVIWQTKHSWAFYKHVKVKTSFYGHLKVRIYYKKTVKQVEYFGIPRWKGLKTMLSIWQKAKNKGCD